MSDPSFVCGTCGQEHAGLPLDFGFRLPDEVHGLGYLDRYLRSRSNADLCTLDEGRYFLRAVLPLALIESDEEFCWGVWVEVSRRCHDVYLSGFHSDLRKQRSLSGRLANSVPGYDGTLGLKVAVQFGDEGSRPCLSFPADVQHALAHEQRQGISHKRHHSILEAVELSTKHDD